MGLFKDKYQMPHLTGEQTRALVKHWEKNYWKTGQEQKLEQEFGKEFKNALYFGKI